MLNIIPHLRRISQQQWRKKPPQVASVANKSRRFPYANIDFGSVCLAANPEGGADAPVGIGIGDTADVASDPDNARQTSHTTTWRAQSIRL